MLRDLNLLPVYDSAEHNLVGGLIVPLLQHSVSYMRGVGFFTSGWLKVASAGMCKLVERGGTGRVVVSPILNRQDWDALQTGERAKTDQALHQALKRNLEELAEALEADTLNCLAWLVADAVLEFRFAVPKAPFQGGDYHDKVGVFRDGQGDTVAIHGSFNDTIKGTLNGEAFSVFKSWEPGQECFATIHQRRLEGLWDHGNKQFNVFRIPEAIREELVQLRNTDGRPYTLPNRPFSMRLGTSPTCPVELHDFQDEAIQAWEDADCHGIFEMATGTGKTLASLAAAVRRRKNLGRLALIVLVPYIHLLDQWERVCRRFGFFAYLCSGNHSGWDARVRSAAQDFRLGSIDDLCILAVHNTAATEKFQRALAKLAPDRMMLIADEVHGLGAPTLRKALLPGAEMRLGLSATPRRWFDDEGTEALFSYFNGVCYEYPLERAIGRYLTPYEYHPILVALSPQEMAAYADLTATIAAIAARAEEDAEVRDRLEMLLLERSRIITGAEGKLPILIDTLRTLVEAAAEESHELRNVLVYCPPGSHRQVLREISGPGLRCHEFVHTVSLRERGRVLRRFSQGDIQVLVAIKCLDEGVDVPSTETAFILASTTNPREFIQRRGRILRLSEGKIKAMVFDFIVIPPEETIVAQDDAGLSVLRREMPRFAEFAAAASNQFEARSVVRDVLDRYEMLHLLDERPWDIYRSLPKMDRDPA